MADLLMYIGSHRSVEKGFWLSDIIGISFQFPLIIPSCLVNLKEPDLRVFPEHTIFERPSQMQFCHPISAVEAFYTPRHILCRTDS